MISIKFRDNIIKTYPYDKLMHLPVFKNMIENFIDDGSVISIDHFDSDIIDHFICQQDINFDKYDFDELFNAAGFLLCDIESVLEQFMKQLKHLLLNDIDKVNLNNLHKYIFSNYKYLLSDVVNSKPDLVQLYPYVTHLRLIHSTDYSGNQYTVDLSKFNNLVELEIDNNMLVTFETFHNLKNLKRLICNYCSSLNDGCFDIFENLEELYCRECFELKKPFNKNLKNLRKLHCIGCYHLEDGCFDALKNLKILDCGYCDRLEKPFDNLINLKIMTCVCCENLRDGCFNMLTNLYALVYIKDHELLKRSKGLTGIEELDLRDE